MNNIARVLNEKLMWRLMVLWVISWTGGVAPEAEGGRFSPLFQEDVPASGQEARLVVNGFSVWSDWHGQIWASVSVQDSDGHWVTDLTLDDFELTECLMSPSQEVVQQRVITFDAPSYQFDGPGFWERSVTGEKLDIVVAIDSTGSMEEEMPGIVRELHDLLRRFETAHVDFRLSIIKYGSDVESVNDSFHIPFQGVMRTQETHDWLDEVQPTSGEWYLPCVGYDLVMFASQLDFRPDARKVVVVISDSVPQTVYGSWWYLDSSTAANMSAVATVLENSDIELLYCSPERLEHLEGYAKPDFNPRALNTGFDTLAERGLAQPIPWPFQQKDIAVAEGPVIDSQYYFAWRTGLEQPDEPENHTVRVTIKVTDPEHPGQFLQGSFSYVPCVTVGRLSMQVVDELNRPLDDVEVRFYREMGDRQEVLYLEEPKGGRIVRDVAVGDYYVVVADSGNYGYAYPNLRYVHRRHITVPPSGLTVSLQVQTADKVIEFAKARGLLHDLSSWGYCEKPFAQFADEALSWLHSVEDGGVDLEEMEAVKRFYMAISGYVNTTGYAEVEVQRAVEDFIQGSKEVRKLLQDLADTGDDLTDSLLDPSTVALLTLYTAAIQQEAIDIYITEEELTRTLVDYVKGPLVREVISKLIDVLPARPDLKNVLQTLIETVLFGRWEDSAGVLQSLVDMALDTALDEAGAALPEASKQALLNALDSLTEVPEQPRAMLRLAVSAFFDRGFNGWDEAFLDEVEDLAGDAIAAVGGKDRVIEELDGAFMKLRADSRVSPRPLRDLVLPLAHMVVKVCVENYQGGTIDDDYVIEVVATLFCNWMALRPLYSAPLLEQMNESLQRARHFACEESDRWVRYTAMSADFGDFRNDIMAPINADAWEALDLQESIDDWEHLLSGVAAALNGLEVFTAAACTFYPAFCDEVDDIHNLISFLDGLRVMSNILAFGLKLENMAVFSERTEYINPTLLPNQLRITGLLAPGTAGLEITWRAKEGLRYRVQCKDDLAEPSWKDVSEEIVARGRSASWTDNQAGKVSSRFYRIAQLE